MHLVQTSLMLSVATALAAAERAEAQIKAVKRHSPAITTTTNLPSLHFHSNTNELHLPLDSDLEPTNSGPQKLPAPGVYHAEPYSMIVIVPGQNSTADRMGQAEQSLLPPANYPDMDLLSPKLELVPMTPPVK